MNHHPTCHPKVWARLTALYAARQTAKNREADLVRRRKDLDGELDKLGAGKSQKHLDVSREYVVVERSIQWQRDRIRSIADRIDETINWGIDGRFDFANDDLDDLTHAPDEAELFRLEERPPAEKPDPHQQTLPVGEPARPEHNGPLDQAIAMHPDIPGPVAKKLAAKSGGGRPTIVTWRELWEHLTAGGDAEINAVTPEEGVVLKATLDRVRKAHAGPRQEPEPPAALRQGEELDKTTGEIAKPRKGRGRKAAGAAA